MTRPYDLILEFQELVKDEDPHWIVRPKTTREFLGCELEIETSYPLEPETCEKITALFQRRLASPRLDISYFAGNPAKIYRKESVNALAP